CHAYRDLVRQRVRDRRRRRAPRRLARGGGRSADRARPRARRAEGGRPLAKGRRDRGHVTRRPPDGRAARCRRTCLLPRTGRERSRGLFVALEGVFQARQADSVSLFRRVGWLNDAVAKLDRAVTLDPGLPRYLRGVVLAGLPERFGKAQAAIDDLTWVLDNKERFPVGLRRGAYYGLAQAHTTLGHETQARGALAKSGA